ncbi:hypothetical protein [Tumebacillus permanentifrigoris]|uniref:Single-stranded DNA-binding protein n=1 Tax=Tumebacillus permanentifrigoris TaxID=378543 RepID=A0A316D856_9BACL|nr:hypothetical protein [Tumebacillus permanentifrigoris]PWK11327.1 hypothetical protein C7459_111122 [Tumebacillus permanentifrigoris]
MSEQFTHDLSGQEATIAPNLFPATPDREGPTIHIIGTITKVLEDDTEGTKHQRFEVRVDDVHGNGDDYSSQQVPQKRDFLKVAVHYGTDGAGIGEHPIPNLQTGERIELQGEYIRHAKVLHFTHHPVGYIEYQSERYE